MIVETGFTTHYKTQQLKANLGMPEAPLYVIELWTQCQLNKKTRFPVEHLAALCRFEGDKKRFMAEMVGAGFIDLVDGDMFDVHDWDQINSQLIANWHNGKKGGRPRKKTHPEPIGNPSGTHPEPIGNPSVTQTGKNGPDKPIGNPSVTHREPIGEEEKRKPPNPPLSGGISDCFTDPDHPHELLVAQAQLAELSWEKDVAARRACGLWPENTTGRVVDMVEAAEYVAGQAAVKESIRHPGDYVMRILARFVEKQPGEVETAWSEGTYDAVFARRG